MHVLQPGSVRLGRNVRRSVLPPSCPTNSTSLDNAACIFDSVLLSINSSYSSFTHPTVLIASDCDAGRYARVAGECFDCEVGRYGSSNGLASCLECEPGMSSGKTSCHAQPCRFHTVHRTLFCKVPSRRTPARSRAPTVRPARRRVLLDKVHASPVKPANSSPTLHRALATRARAVIILCFNFWLCLTSP